MAPLYTASSTNNTFYLSTDMLGWAHAEADCNLMGGHLASYSSRQEQVRGWGCFGAGSNSTAAACLQRLGGTGVKCIASSKTNEPQWCTLCF